MAVVAATTPSPSQTFSDHVSELRVRLAWIVGAVAFSGAVGYVFRNLIVKFLQKPLNQPLYYFNPAGSFNFIMKISFFTGAIVAMPIFAWQLVRFIEPALRVKIRSSTLAKLIGSVMVLAITGVTFAYYVIVPTSLQFFGKYSNSLIKPLISADDYLSFIISCLVTFAVMFQIPLIILFINRITPLPPRKLMRYQRHVVIGAFILAVLLPFTYDPITQFAMAVPIVFLFYLSVILLWIVQTKQRRRDNKLARLSHKRSRSRGLRQQPHLTIDQWTGVQTNIQTGVPLRQPQSVRPATRPATQPATQPARPLLRRPSSQPTMTLDGLRRVQTRT